MTDLKSLHESLRQFAEDEKNSDGTDKDMYRQLKEITANKIKALIETEVKPKSKVYGALEDVPKSLFDAGFIDEEHVSFEQTDFGVFDIGRCLKF